MPKKSKKPLTKLDLLDLWQSKARCAWTPQKTWVYWQDLEPRLTKQELTLLTVACSHIDLEGPGELDEVVLSIREKWLHARKKEQTDES